jgi:hypothetical protein
VKNRKLSRISNDFILISDSMDLTMKTLLAAEEKEKEGQRHTEDTTADNTNQGKVLY